MDPLTLRQDFPVLAGDDPPVYLDNACMPMKPEPVLAAMDDYYRNFPTCGGRSLHRLAFLERFWVTSWVLRIQK